MSKKNLLSVLLGVCIGILFFVMQQTDWRTDVLEGKSSNAKSPNTIKKISISSNTLKTGASTENLRSLTLMESAQSDPMAFLKSIKEISRIFYENGSGSPEDLNILLLPALEKALENIFINDPGKAFSELYKLREISSSLAYKTMPYLIKIGIRSNPETVVNGLRAFEPDLHFLARSITEEWAGVDPLKAANWAISILNKTSKTSPALDAALKIWIKKSATDTQKWVESIGDMQLKLKAQTSLINLSFESGIDVVPLINEFANSLDSSGNAKTLQEAMIKWEKSNSSAMAEWLKTQPDSPTKERLFGLSALAKIVNSSMTMNESLGEIYSSDERRLVVEKAADKLIAKKILKPDSAWNTIAQLENPELRAVGFASILNSGLYGFPDDPKGKKILNLLGKSMGSDSETILVALLSTNSEQIGKMRGLWSDLDIEESMPTIPGTILKKFVSTLNKSISHPE